MIDEPTTGQDVITRQEIAEELRHVADQGVAVLLLTHDLELVRAVADRVAVLARGTVLQVDGPDRLWRRPVDDEVAALVDEAVTEARAAAKPTEADLHTDVYVAY